MNSRRLGQAGLALGLAIGITGAGFGGTLAQENLGAAVTIGGGTAGVTHGDIAALAPGVTISGGEVTNATGIGIDSAGGSSIGATAGGNDSAAVVE